MKKMNIKVRGNSNKCNMERINTFNLASDWFKCRNCGYTVRKLVLGNTATCSECGGTMDRC